MMSTDLTEIGYFLADLKAQMAYFRPADRITFVQKYFEQIRSTRHVVGMPYGYITESNHNRRSFVLCLMESFMGMPESMEISTADFFSLIETLSANFPKSIVLDVSQCIQRPVEGDGSNTVHHFKSIAFAVYCYILYEDWLRLIAEYFAEESSTNSMNILKFKAKIEEFYVSISPSVMQPPLELVYSVLDASNPSNFASGTSSYLTELSFDQFRKTLFLSDIMRENIRNLQSMQPI